MLQRSDNMSPGTSVDIEISGISNIKKRIDGIKTAPKRKGQKWSYRSAQGVAQIARRKAPSHTGTLKKSIKPKRLNLSGDKRGAAVVASTKEQGNPLYPGRDYAKAVEFGTSGVSGKLMAPPSEEAEMRGLPYKFYNRAGTSAQPFMRPAFYKSRSKHKQFVAAGWSEEIKKYLK